MVIEAPGAYELAHANHFRGRTRIRKMSENAVERRNALGDCDPLPIVLAHSDHRTVAIHQGRCGPQYLAGPNDFAFDLRIEIKCRLARDGIAEIDAVAEFFGGKTQPQAD